MDIPLHLAISMTASSLVEIHNSSSIFKLFNAKSIDYSINGFPPSNLMFLPGKPFEPFLAGIRYRILIKI